MYVPSAILLPGHMHASNDIVIVWSQFTNYLLTIPQLLLNAQNKSCKYEVHKGHSNKNASVACYYGELLEWVFFWDTLYYIYYLFKPDT